jgi:hypothetical protein
MAERGPMAALLYTWMIPHAEDDGSLSGDPEEILLAVLPGAQRELDPADVAGMIDAMQALDLIERDGGRIRFPQSFFQYQSYITEQRRQPRKSPRPASIEEARVDNAADQRTSPQNSTLDSFPVSSSFSFPVPSSFNEDMAANAAVPAPDTELSDSYQGPPGDGYPLGARLQEAKPVETSQVAAVFGEYQKRVHAAARLTDEAKRKIATRLRTWTADELLLAMDHFASDEWEVEHNAHRGAAWFFHSDQRIEQYLNLPPRKHTGSLAQSDLASDPNRFNEPYMHELEARQRAIQEAKHAAQA